MKRSQSLLERVDLLLRDPEPVLALERHGEVGAEVEELVLDAHEHRARCASGHSPARTTPSAEFSSSTVP